MSLPPRLAVRLCFQLFAWLAVAASAGIGSATTAAEASGDNASIGAAIGEARGHFAELIRGRPDTGDNPLAKDYGAKNQPFAESLRPVLAELDAIVDKHPDSAAALIERSRVRLVYQAYFPEQTGRAFNFEHTAQDLARATELEPANAAAWFELGLAHMAELRTEGSDKNVMNLLLDDAEKAAAKKNALTAAVHAFSRAIHAQPDASGRAHLARTWAQRALELGGDPNQTFVDANAAIAQDLRPTDAAWDALYHATRPRAQLDAQLADAYVLRGKSLLTYGKSAEALEDLGEALKLEPKNVSALFERGKLLVRRGEWAAAVADFTVVVSVRPAVADGWFWRGIAHDGAGELELATADLAQAAQRNPAVQKSLAKTRYDLTEPNPARGIAPRPSTADARTLPPGTAADHKNAGNALRGKGDTYGAMREYTFAALIDPQYADAFNNRGSVYSEWRMFELAMLEYDRAIELDPKHRAAFLNRGFLWRELGDRAREREDFDRAVEFADNDDRRAEALLARGHTFENAQETAPAEADYRRATELAPTKAAAWTALAYLEANQSRFADAAPHFRSALAVDPENLHARIVLAVMLAMLDDADSMTELDTVLENVTKRDQTDEASAIIDRAFNAHPDNARLQAMKDKLDKKKAARVLFV